MRTARCGKRRPPARDRSRRNDGIGAAWHLGSRLPGARAFATAEDPPDKKTKKSHRSDVPRAELADTVVGHVFPPAVTIDDGLLEKHPGVEEGQPDSESDDSGH